MLSLNDSILLFVAILALVGGLAWIARSLAWRYPIASIREREQEMTKRIDALTFQIGEMANQRQDERAAAERFKAELTATRQELAQTRSELELTRTENTKTRQALVEAQAEIRNLQATVGRLSAAGGLAAASLLAIFGPDEAITQRDLNALTRARVDFSRLRHARKVDVSDEFRRRRKDGNVPTFVHIASHGGESGSGDARVGMIELVDGPADMQFWLDQLRGVRIVMLASCRSGLVADELAGVVDYVVYFREGVKNVSAEDFTEAWWARIVSGARPDAAFAEARREVPDVANFVDMRVPRKQGAGGRGQEGICQM